MEKIKKEEYKKEIVKILNETPIDKQSELIMLLLERVEINGRRQGIEWARNQLKK